MNILADTLKLQYFYYGIPAIFSFCAFIVFLQRLSHNYSRIKDLDPEIVGGFFQVIGSIYAILIGLVVYDATSRYSDAHANVVDESKALVSIFLLADQITQIDLGETIKKLDQDYVNEVVNHDWDHLETETVNIKARWLIKELNRKILALSPASKNEEIIYPIMMQTAMDAWRYRMSRFDISTHRLPISEWILLLTGGLVTITVTFFYHLECRRSQSILTFLTSFIIAFSLYAILLFSEPYKGDFKVSKKPFEIAQGIMDGSYFRQESLY